MSREKDFIEAAERLAETKKTEDAKQQCLYDFGIAADYGYQYAIDKACEVIARLYPEAAAYYEQPETFVEQIRKAMEE